MDVLVAIPMEMGISIPPKSFLFISIIGNRYDYGYKCEDLNEFVLELN